MQNSNHDYITIKPATEEVCIFNVDTIVLTQAQTQIIHTAVPKYSVNWENLPKE